jgi:integrase
MPQPRKRPLFEFGGQWIANDPDSRMLYRFWTSPGTGRTSRASLGCTDLEAAKLKLAEIVIKGAPKTVDAPLSVVLETYFTGRTDKLPSGKVARGHGRKILEFVGKTARVKILTEAKQKEFVARCEDQGHKLAYAARIMATLSAALLHSKLKEPEIIATEAKMIDKWQFASAEPKKAYIPTDAECAELLLADRVTESLLRWAIIQGFTGGRPQTAVDLAPTQFRRDSGVVDLKVPGQPQIKKKFRPKVKAGRTFRLLLRAWERRGLDAFGGRYCGYSSMEGVTSALDRIATDTGIPVSSYSIRHKVTSILRAAAVPEDQVSEVLGHKRPSLRTTAGYGEFHPNYQKEAAAALEDWFWRIVRLTRKLEADKAANSRDTPDNVRVRTKRAA